MNYLSDDDVKRIRAKYPKHKRKAPESNTFEKGGSVYASSSNANGLKAMYASFGKTRRIAYSAEDQPHYVYFIQSDENEYIKIGHTSDLNKRKSQLQTGSAAQLSYVGTILFPNEQRAIEIEELIHKSFDTMRLHGEWFAPDESLIAFIKTHTRDTDELSLFLSTQNSEVADSKPVRKTDAR